MKDLLRLESAKIWTTGLIVAGVLVIIIAVIMQRAGFGRVYPVPPWEHEILILMLGLGIVFTVVGIVLKKICTCISQTMQEYDEELHKKFDKMKADVLIHSK